MTAALREKLRVLLEIKTAAIETSVTAATVLFFFTIKRIKLRIKRNAKVFSGEEFSERGTKQLEEESNEEEEEACCFSFRLNQQYKDNQNIQLNSEVVLLQECLFF